MPDHYGTLAGALAYHQARANTTWAATGGDEDRQAALLRASVWIDNTYRSRFSGKKIGGRTQLREWPRTDAVDAAGDEIAADEVPPEIEEAAYEAALRELAKPDSLAPDFDGRLQIKAERVKVGSIEEETEYQAASTITPKPTYALIDGILHNVLVAPPGNTSVAALVRY
ncbi:DnaT-like ssDNA-binding protein [Neorhizobium vignae]|uniref:DnaT-like ssDNA-binding protein n=1 Tax=Neorhizobium vignae TaxID=690585 RepID=UPI000561B2AC|nr:DnaT-like ssDNA-binding protein [Neorhizobium vignae]